MFFFTFNQDLGGAMKKVLKLPLVSGPFFV